MFESTEKARFELRNKLDGAEAALAKQRPLIEAVRALLPENLNHAIADPRTYCAALAYKTEKEKA